MRYEDTHNYNKFKNVTPFKCSMYEYFIYLGIILLIFLLQYNLIPRAILSLKALAELPIIVVLMYQLYKVHVHKDVEEFIPLVITTITLQPTAQQR